MNHWLETLSPRLDELTTIPSIYSPRATGYHVCLNKELAARAKDVLTLLYDPALPVPTLDTYRAKELSIRWQAGPDPEITLSLCLRLGGPSKISFSLGRDLWWNGEIYNVNVFHRLLSLLKTT